MKHVFKDATNISNKLEKKNIALLLDFDLTLSPLATNPKQALLPETTKTLLKEIVKCMPVVIISGRKLSDIKKRVNIKGLLYVGNHGLEHNLNKKYEISEDISDFAKKALSRVKKDLEKINRKYPEIVFEDKKYSIALGYRLVKSTKVRFVESLFRNIQKEIRKEGILETRLDKKTFEARAKTEVNKGTACLLALENLQSQYQKKFTPVYIGDSETDEDAFKALNKNGITIRVGKNSKSSAKWYLKKQSDVSLFLQWILSALNQP